MIVNELLYIIASPSNSVEIGAVELFGMSGFTGAKIGTDTS